MCRLIKNFCGNFLKGKKNFYGLGVCVKLIGLLIDVAIIYGGYKLARFAWKNYKNSPPRVGNSSTGRELRSAKLGLDYNAKKAADYYRSL